MDAQHSQDLNSRLNLEASGLAIELSLIYEW